MRRAAAFFAMLALPGAALAHDDSDHGGLGWTLDPWVTAPLALAAILYGIGHYRLAARSSQGRRQLRRDALCFALGWVVLTGALVSPLHAGGERSFALHMIEHELIMLPAALLLVMAEPGPVLLWAFPEGARQALGSIGRGTSTLWRALTQPFVATGIQGAAMWAWHVPSLFDRTLASDGWHIAQHLSFVGSALLFWWAMVHRQSGRQSEAVSAFCLFATSMIGGLLGALMTFSSSPWYEGYAAMGMSPIGLTPTEDQQLAGLIMWIPGGLVHAGAALLFLHHWLKASEKSHAVAAQ